MAKNPTRRGLFSRLRTDSRGVALLEFAFIAPIMIALYFGCVEFCLGLMANKRAGHTAAAFGDLVAQYPSLTATQINDLFMISRTSMLPYDRGQLRLRVSQIRRTTQTAFVVDWSCHKNWSTRTSTAGAPTNTLAVGQSLILAESEFNYDSPVDAFLPGLTVYRSQMPYRPRTVERIAGVNGAANPACPGAGW